MQVKGVYSVPVKYFYDLGNEFSAVTGGWGSSKSSGAETSRGTSYLAISCQDNKDCRGRWYTINMIDVSNFSKLAFEVQFQLGRNYYDTVQVGIGSSQTNLDRKKATIRGGPISDTRTIQIDVSDITGEYYITAMCTDEVTTVDGSSWLRIYSVWGKW